MREIIVVVAHPFLVMIRNWIVGSMLMSELMLLLLSQSSQSALLLDGVKEKIGQVGQRVGRLDVEWLCGGLPIEVHSVFICRRVSITASAVASFWGHVGGRAVGHDWVRTTKNGKRRYFHAATVHRHGRRRRSGILLVLLMLMVSIERGRQNVSGGKGEIVPGSMLARGSITGRRGSLT